VAVAGFYPNVETVLPGTQLARSLNASGLELDWYHPQRTPEFGELEDGCAGFNFSSLDVQHSRALHRQFVERIRTAAVRILLLGQHRW
jgi:hypothetical protein